MTGPPLIYQKLIKQLTSSQFASEEQLLEQWTQSSAKENTFREQLLKTGVIKDIDYQKAVGTILNLEFVDKINPLELDNQNRFTETIPIRFAKKFLFFPYHFSEDQLSFAVLNPWPNHAYEEAAKALDFDEFSLVISTEEIILEAINQVYDRNTGSAEEAAEVLVDDADLDYLSHLSFFSILMF